MKSIPRNVILVAEDDPDDRLLINEAFQENALAENLFFVEDGVELIKYLNREAPYDSENAPYPQIILLDLNMPKMDGREALKIIKASHHHRKTPIIVLTTSSNPEEIITAYDLGVNSFITKPSSFQELVDTTKILGNYWFEVAKVPES